MAVSNGGWRLEAMPFDEPCCVVDLAEFGECVLQLLDRGEALHLEEILLQVPDKALGAPIALRRVDEGRRTLSTPRVVSSCWNTTAMYWLP